MTYTKTNWVNGQAPAISASNLNKIETELETLETSVGTKLNASAVKTSNTSSDNDTYSCTYVNTQLNSKQDNGVVLWTNQNPTSNFTSTQINLATNNCNYFEIIYATRLSETNEVASSGKIPFGKRVRLFYAFTSGAYLGVGQRVFLTSTTSKLTLEDGYIQNANSQTASKDNSICVPLYVIGYK